jgi:hypothetical protein
MIVNRDLIFTVFRVERPGHGHRHFYRGGNAVADLKLGPLPKQSTVKVTVVLSELLKEELDAYAAAHSRLYDEPVETTALIPHMLEAFLRADPAWRNHRKQRRKANSSPPSQSSSNET